MTVWTTPALGALWQSFNMVGIGDRIAAYRRRRGLSQVTLAGLVGRSESWLSQVERGRRGVDSLTVIRDLATALGTTPDTLIGVDLPAPSGSVGHTATDAVRRYVDGYSQLLTAPQTPTGTAAQLLEEAETLNASYQAANYDQALASSPTLLAAVDALTRSDTGPEAVHVYVAAYVITAKILHKIGESRLAALAADRAAAMASRPGATGVDRGLAAREVVGALLYTGQTTAAEALAVDMATSLEADPDAHSPDLLSLRGSLLLLAAVIAARRTERFVALERLDIAEQLADQLGYDGNHCWTAFGPTNVAIHAVSVAAELGDAGEAVRLSHRVNPSDLPAGLVSRRAQLHLDLAWAYTQHRRDAEAIVQLLEAEQIAPQLIQFHPVVRDAVADLVGRSRTSSGVLHDLAIRAGVLN
jgi:transcriptional regulator with XRE-family HTH domain